MSLKEKIKNKPQMVADQFQGLLTLELVAVVAVENYGHVDEVEDEIR